MKNTLLTAIAFVTALGLSAQSISFINPMSIVTGSNAQLGASGEIVAEWHVQNSSDSDKAVRARRNVISEVSGSVNYFCWGVCFDETTNVSPAGLAQLIPPGGINTTFYAHYKPMGNAGETVIEYCFFNASDINDQTCQTVRYCVDVECLVNQNEIEEEFVISDLSPNPLKGLGSFTYEFKNQPQTAKFVVRNMVGQIVKETNIQGKSGVVIVDGAEYTSGIYLYSIVADGKTLSTKRMIVQ